MRLLLKEINDVGLSLLYPHFGRTGGDDNDDDEKRDDDEEKFVWIDPK